MNDVMGALRDRRAKAESKVARAVKALEAAKIELADLLAAERVMAEITGESLDQRSDSTATSERDLEIARLLNSDRQQALSPADLYSRYTEASGDTINLDAFRTALWRLQKKAIKAGENEWSVRSHNGRYWREETPVSNDDLDELLG